MNREDKLLSAFIARTGMTDPGLARDLLAGTDWDLQAAEQTYRVWHSAMAAPSDQHTAQRPAELTNGRSTPVGSERRYQTAYSVLETDCGPIPTEHAARRDRNGNDSSLLGSKAALCMEKGLTSCPLDVRDNTVNSDREAHGDAAWRAAAAAAEPPVFVRGTEYTFKMPDTSAAEPDFAAFVEKKLIDTTMLSNLESTGRLNWWAAVCCKLLPRHTTADGNCLLHAASLGMWGCDDKELQLRKALYRVMVETRKGDSLYRRWRWQQMQLNKQMELVYSEAEWDREWQELLNLASPKPKYVASRASIDGSSGNGSSEPARRSRSSSVGSKSGSSSRSHRREEVYYKSLEEFHVFVLAQVLRRPIVVVADTVLKSLSGDALHPLTFGGVYLPLDCSQSDRHQAPLLIAYDSSHFSALMPLVGGSDGSCTDGPWSPTPEAPALVPLTDPEGNLLPLRFVVDPGENFDWTEKSESTFQDMSADSIITLLRNYLKIEYVEWPGSASNGKVTSVETDVGPNKSTKKGMKAFIGLKNWTLGRKSKKLANGTLKGKTRSKDSLDEASSMDSLRGATVDGKRNAESPSEYLLCAWLLIKTVPHYDELTRHYLNDCFHAFELERRWQNPHTTTPPDMPSASSESRTGSEQAFSGRGATVHDLVGKAGHGSKVDIVTKGDSASSFCRVLSGGADVPIESRLDAVCILDPRESQCTTMDQPAISCRTNGCSMFGTAANDHFCSQCYSARSKQRLFSPTPAPRHTLLHAATDSDVVPNPQVSRQWSRDKCTGDAASSDLTDDEPSYRNMSQHNSTLRHCNSAELYDNLPSESEGVPIAHQSTSRGYITTAVATEFDDPSPPSACATLVLYSDNGYSPRDFGSGKEAQLSSSKWPPQQNHQGVGGSRGSTLVGSQVAEDGAAASAGAACLGSTRSSDVKASNGSFRLQPQYDSLDRIQTSASGYAMQPAPLRAAAHHQFPTALVVGPISRQQPEVHPRAAVRSAASQAPVVATTVSRPEPHRPAAAATSSVAAQRGPQQRPSALGPPAAVVSVATPAERSIAASRAATAAVTPPLPLYYAQRQQPAAPLLQPSASGSCRLKGCKEPAKFDGKCVKCYNSTQSAWQYGQKLRRSIRQPRSATNFQL